MPQRQSNAKAVAQALNSDPAKYAEIIIGEKPVAKGARFHRFGANGALRVYVSGPRRGKWTRFGQSNFGDMIDLIRYVENIDLPAAIDFGKDLLGNKHEDLPPIDTAAEDRALKAETEKNIRTARYIWSRCRHVSGTPGIAYHLGRGIQCYPAFGIGFRRLDPATLEKLDLEPDAFPDGAGAIVYAVADRGKVHYVQQILLNGPNVANVLFPKRSYGELMDGAFQLGEIKDLLVLAEGPATGLSVWQETGLPTWVTFGSGNLSRARVPACVRRLIIAADNDPTGEGFNAAVDAAEIFIARGIKVRIAIPASIGDFNNVLLDAGGDEVRNRFRDLVDPTPYLEARIAETLAA